MNNLLKNRYALSTVVTTLIILVVSVLLASVVTYFAINVVNTRVQEEGLVVTKLHVWTNSSASPGTVNYAQAALMIINTGGRDVVFDKITVRGQESSWNDTTGSNLKFIAYNITDSSISTDLPYVPNLNYTGATVTNQATISGTAYPLTVPNNDIILKSGNTMIVYIVNPDSVSIDDIGLTTSITVHTAQAMYYRECNVEGI